MTPTRFLVIVALVGGCYAKQAETGDGPMSGTGLALPDGAQADAATGDLGAPSGGDGSLDATAGDTTAPDARADALDPRVMAYEQFLDQQGKVWSARWQTCFNTPPEALTPGISPLYDDTPDQHAYSLAHALVLFDPTKAQACLDLLRTLPCEGLVSQSYRPACQVLVGQVASGGFCDSPEDCQDAAASCETKESHGCLAHCTVLARAGLGEACTDRPCGPGTYCAADDGRCHTPGGEGAVCPDSFACLPGSWCQPAAAGNDSGTCRKVQAGLACLGSWQCPYAYACLIPTGATTGTCQAGHKRGEACSFHGKDQPNGPYSDCANGLYCYPGATGQFTCGVGRELGDTCADLDVGATVPLSVPCRVGSCRLSSGTLRCVPDQTLNQPCSEDLPCQAGLVCAQGHCADPVVKLGERCTSDGTYQCPEGARCALAANTAQGTCVLIKHVGETCADPDDCELGASCTGGVCTACQ